MYQSEYNVLNLNLWRNHEITYGNEHYNRELFPIFVAHHGNWDIYRNESGYCAAIAVVDGCASTHFGDYNYTRSTLSLEGINLPVNFV